MGLHIKIALRIACFGVLLLSSNLAVAERAVPKLNMNQTCESKATRMLFDNSSKHVCIKHKNESHQALIQHWSQYHKADKTDCVGKVVAGGPPSYSELLSCIETREHARAARKKLQH